MQHEVWKRPSCYQTWSGCCQLHTNLCARSQYIQQQRFPYPLVALPSTGTSRKIPVSCLDLNPYHEVCCICVSAQPGIKAGRLLLAYFKAIHIFINNNNFSYADNLQELNENCYRKQQRWSVICQPATSSCLSKCCKLLPVLLSVQALGRQESFQGKEQCVTCKQGERLCSAQHWCPDSLLSPCCRWKIAPFHLCCATRMNEAQLPTEQTYGMGTRLIFFYACTQLYFGKSLLVFPVILSPVSRYIFYASQQMIQELKRREDFAVHWLHVLHTWWTQSANIKSQQTKRGTVSARYTALVNKKRGCRLNSPFSPTRVSLGSGVQWVIWLLSFSPVQAKTNRWGTWICSLWYTQVG